MIMLKKVALFIDLRIYYNPTLKSNKKAQQPAIQLPKFISAIGTFAPQTSTNQNKAAYELNVELDDSKTFQVKSAITVNNLSSDIWNELVFYFIPNAFTKENKPERMTSASTVSIKRVAINGESTPFDLKNDILLLKPVNGMEAGAEAKVEIEYSMTIPENGARLSESNEKIIFSPVVSNVSRI
ncbi:hypothetical protein [Neobacillus novalis]|nr:hypothetical protein [Neobacillus novalis]